MTQPEPTRDPRLLSADDIGTLTRLSAATDDLRWTSKVVRDLLAHIAAQDQRHAALVEAAKVIVQEPDTYTQYLDRVEAVEEALAALAKPPGDEIRGD